ncbi:MAG TPA: hypothetical protein VFB68_12935 [Xanthobacteraceae bacterium]|nr:hypothetical protein [Xanthobacteraceae bacterium]
MSRRLLLGVAIAIVATPALCAQFYIVRNDATNQCTIVEEPPTSGGTIVGDGAYGDRATAEADMKTLAVCTPPTTQIDPQR